MISSVELRYYLKYAPLKLLIAFALVGYDLFKKEGITLNLIASVMLAYGMISVFAYTARLARNWITGLIATLLIFGIYLFTMNSMPLWLSLAIIFVLGFLGPIMDIIFTIMLVRVSRREKKEYNLAMENEKQYAEHIKMSEDRARKIGAADELMRYKELLDAGAITQEEFDLKKKQIMGF